MKKTIKNAPDADAGNPMPSQIEIVPTPRYGDKKAVAQMIGMSRRSVDNFLRAGCPHLRLGQRRVRFDLAEVRAWLREKYHVQRRGAAKSPVPA